MNTKKKISFDQFLFDQFKIKKTKATVLRTDSFISKVSEPRETDSKIKKNVLNQRVSKKSKIALSLDESPVCGKDKKETLGLTEALESIPDKDKATKVESLAHQHESEWYHAFRDLKEEIALDLSKKHPNYKGVFKFKNDIKEFWEQFDEYIEGVVLELEKVFQNFPNMSRVAVIYLLAIVISLPIVFFSFHQDQKVAYNSLLENKVNTAQKEIIKFTDKMKSDYVAKNSAEILASGRKIIQVTRGVDAGRVAGAYEDNSEKLTKDKLGQKIFSYYHYLSELKDEFIYNFKKKIKL